MVSLRLVFLQEPFFHPGPPHQSPRGPGTREGTRLESLGGSRAPTGVTMHVKPPSSHRRRLASGGLGDTGCRGSTDQRAGGSATVSSTVLTSRHSRPSPEPSPGSLGVGTTGHRTPSVQTCLDLETGRGVEVGPSGLCPGGLGCTFGSPLGRAQGGYGVSVPPGHERALRGCECATPT